MIYTINYSVSGREPAPNVVLNDPLPLQVDFVSASNGGTYDRGHPPGDLEPGQPCSPGTTAP